MYRRVLLALELDCEFSNYFDISRNSLIQHRGTLGFYWLDDEIATILAINKHRREGTVILSQFKIDLDHRNRTLITRVRRLVIIQFSSKLPISGTTFLATSSTANTSSACKTLKD